MGISSVSLQRNSERKLPQRKARSRRHSLLTGRAPPTGSCVGNWSPALTGQSPMFHNLAEKYATKATSVKEGMMRSHGAAVPSRSLPKAPFDYIDDGAPGHDWFERLELKLQCRCFSPWHHQGQYLAIEIRKNEVCQLRSNKKIKK